MSLQVPVQCSLSREVAVLSHSSPGGLPRMSLPMMLGSTALTIQPRKVPLASRSSPSPSPVDWLWLSLFQDWGWEVPFSTAWMSGQYQILH